MTDACAEWRRLCREAASEKLAATLRPDPDYRARKLAQFDSARRQRYFDACYGVPHSLRGQG